MIPPALVKVISEGGLVPEVGLRGLVLEGRFLERDP